MSASPRTPTPVLIKALEALSRDVQSEDGVANAALFEAAQRMGEMEQFIRKLAEDFECHGEGGLKADQTRPWCRCCEAKQLLGVSS